MSIALAAYKPSDRINLIQDGVINPLLSFARSTTATYLNYDGLKTTLANALRYEYDAIPAYKGLLLEGAATNLLTYSDGTVAQLSLSGGVTNATSTISSFFANSLQFPSSSSSTNYAYKAYTQTNGLIYIISTFVKMDDGSTPVASTTNGSGDFCFVVQGNVAVSTPVVVAVGNGIYRISAYTTATSTGSKNCGVVQYGSQSRKGFRVTGLQIEQSSIASSYIPTTTAAVTRSADVLQLTSLGQISATQGAFVIEHDIPSGQPLLYSGSNKILDSSGGTKVVIAYDGSGTAISINGGAVTTSGTPLTFGSTLDIGKSAGAHCFGHIKRMTYYKTRRLNADIVRMSV